jgi:peptide/nickel transport system substrate-binding protein
MVRKKIALGLKGSEILFKPISTMVITLLLISLLTACAAPAATTQIPTSTAPAASTAAAARPQGEVIVGLQSLGSENWLPWLDASFSNLHNLVYDMLIYWDHVNKQFFPGLAERWEVTPDGMTTTFHLRKGIQYDEGWGEFTSADVKFNLEMQASPKSTGKTAITRRIASMETPDPYTLIVNFKDPFPTFFVEMSMANSGVCQGFVSKKYYDTAGEDIASQKPVGTGPYRLVDSQPGLYFKFEAKESHWRLVPEFKTLTARLITETSTVVAALKNKEIDLSRVTAEQLVSLKAAGVAVEVSPLGGNILMVGLGGMVVADDTRYDAAYHNKDPWVDQKVRKAMAIAIDREAICKAIYAGFADPASVPLFSKDMDQYQYPYDPAAARQLLKDAGYPDGFSFKVMSYVHQASQEAPRIAEALAAYWQEIGLDPQITVVDWSTYYTRNIGRCKTAGEVWIMPIGAIADMLTKAQIFLIPNAVQTVYQDDGSAAIYNGISKNATFEERAAAVDKLNQYYFENACPIPVVRNGFFFAWNADKVSAWPHVESTMPLYLEYLRHAQPLNTYSAFRPWPDR